MASDGASSLHHFSSYFVQYKYNAWCCLPQELCLLHDFTQVACFSGCLSESYVCHGLPLLSLARANSLLRFAISIFFVKRTETTGKMRTKRNKPGARDKRDRCQRVYFVVVEENVFTSLHLRITGLPCAADPLGAVKPFAFCGKQICCVECFLSLCTAVVGRLLAEKVETNGHRSCAKNIPLLSFRTGRSFADVLPSYRHNEERPLTSNISSFVGIPRCGTVPSLIEMCGISPRVEPYSTRTVQRPHRTSI